MDEPEVARSDAGSDGKLGELVDVGPAAPATASPQGAVLVKRTDELVIARLEGKGDEARVRGVEAEADEFSAFARGPAVAGQHAYWINRAGELRQGALSGGSTKVLATDARAATRVAAVERDGRPPAVAYISEKSGALSAKLWQGGQQTVALTPDGGAANSVCLVGAGDDLLALSLEGRTGMTTLHARQLEYQGKRYRPRSDVVVWVGGSAQPLTEVEAVGDKTGFVWGLVAMERDISRFGLARVEIGRTPSMNSKVIWRDYANGLDPAPVAAAEVCGKPALVYARPADATPRSPQELHLAFISDARMSPPLLIARSRAFSNVSLAALADGGLVVYVADRRTWARTLRC